MKTVIACAPMKHETFNTIIAALGLLVATTTAMVQFWPSSDQIHVVSEGLVDVGSGVQIFQKATPNPTDGTLDSAVGPSVWKIRITNTSNKSVAIVNYELMRLSDDRLSKSNAFKERLSPQDPSLVLQTLPVNIAPWESKAFLFSLRLPIQVDRDTLVKCGNRNRSLRDLQNCVLSSGFDFFGNEVEPYLSDGQTMGAKWKKVKNRTDFIVNFITSDNSKFPVMLSYFPF